MKLLLKSTLIGLLVTSFLSGCTPGSFDGEVLVRTHCPPMKSYDKAKIARLANEVDALPDKSELADVLTDYHQVRRICRSLEKR